MDNLRIFIIILLITFDMKKQAGTKITLIFHEEDSKTRISTNVNLRFKGILVPFGYIPDSNLESAMNTILDSFVNHLKLKDKSQ